MKKFKNILLAGLVVGAFYSCEDAYKITQKGEFNDDVAFQSVGDMQLVLAEVYDRVDYENEIAFTSIFTDEAAIGESNGGQNLTEFRHNLMATNGYPSAIWLQKYNLINYVNRLIEGSTRFEIDEDDVDAIVERDRILAEARALRALAYLELESYFAVDMKDDNGLGVILYNEVPDVLPNVPRIGRSTNAQIFDAINEDLDFAEAHLQAGNPVSLVNANLITGIRARMALYRGQHAEAQMYADMVLATYPGLNQGLTTRANYAAMWANTTTGDLIFGLERPRGKSGIVSNWFFNDATFGGGAFLEVSRGLYNELNSNSTDIRTQVVVNMTESIFDPNYEEVVNYRDADVLILGKYPGLRAQQLPLNNRIPVMRVVEMHYIKAEAQIAQGDLAGARTTINRVRAQRLTGTAAQLPATLFDNAQSAYNELLKERRKELAFEGFRYLDLKRLGTLAGVTGLQHYVRDCAPYGACDLSVTDYRFTLPIPTAEINGNPVIGTQQNPGYN